MIITLFRHTYIGHMRMCFGNWTGVFMGQNMSRKALVNASCSPILWTPASEYDITMLLLTWSHGEYRAKCHGSKDYPNRESAKYFTIISYTYTITRRIRLL